ncbi:MAG: ribosomal protein S18-alanine N-acetyltransferase [Paracoccaceae bacterium]
MTPPDIAVSPSLLAALQARAYVAQAPWQAQDFADVLARPTTQLWTSPSPDPAAPTGFLLAQIIPDEAEVLALAIDPKAQRQGLARALLDRFHQDSAAVGITSVLLEVSADNVPAQALYLGAGYQAVGHRRGYYRHPDGTRRDAVLMRCCLTRSFT